MENYADRKTGQFIEQYQTKVADEFANFPKPQDMSNHEDVRWCALTDNGGRGIQVVADGQMSVAPLQHSAVDMILAGHPHQLPAPGDTYLHLDLGVTGLGGNSCGQGGPLAHDRVCANQHFFGFIIRPAAANLTRSAQVACAGEVPLSIVRSKAGEVTITSPRTDAEICYTIGGGKKAQTFTAPIPMRDGGTVTAWFKSTPDIKTTQTFSKIENVAVEVINASSEETYEGNASNLVDDDANTIWHTMYSVTVAKHPHWVDLDAGETRLIKGFEYLPRQDGDNGNVKDYQVLLSTDGKIWGNPVAASTVREQPPSQESNLPQPDKSPLRSFHGS